MATLRSAMDLAASAYRTRLSHMSHFQKKVKMFNFNNSYYNQVGLLKHDWLPHSPVLLEALRRLPREETEARDFRIARATLLAASKTILPKEQWTTLENDVPYLQPYIEVVDKELSDRSDWDSFVDWQVYRGEH